MAGRALPNVAFRYIFREGRGSAGKSEGRPMTIRVFNIDGEETTTTTHRTRIVEAITPVQGRSFLDLGACEGYESRALAVRGASSVVAVEGRADLVESAKLSLAGYSNARVIQGDVRTIDREGLGTFDVVCCFGLLYHMSNPFNLLKRLAAVCGDTLLLETHIAPEPWAEKDLVPKLRGSLLRGTKTLYLDGARFEGRVCIHRGAHAKSIGSLDAPWTFWLTASSLAKALTLAGFSILQWHHEIDENTPPAIAKNGRDLKFGHANTKIFVVAKVGERPAVTDGTVSSAPDRVVAPQFSESLLDQAVFQFERVRRRVTG